MRADVVVPVEVPQPRVVFHHGSLERARARELAEIAVTTEAARAEIAEAPRAEIPEATAAPAAIEV